MVSEFCWRGGTEEEDFRHDSFGNLRSELGVGAAVGTAGGDFRFQGVGGVGCN